MYTKPCRQYTNVEITKGNENNPCKYVVLTLSIYFNFKKTGEVAWSRFSVFESC